jgi:uncharacterized integral membrane protein
MNASGLTKIGAAVQFIYCTLSLFLIFDYNIGYTDNFWNKQSVDSTRTMFFTICVHGILMGIMVFIHINQSSMSQSLTVGRSLTFALLSILWSYIVGVRNTISALHTKEDCKVRFVSRHSSVYSCLFNRHPNE